MPTFYIAEFDKMGSSPNSGPQVPQEPPLIEQTLAIGGGAVSAVFQPTTRLVRLHCDGSCSFLFGKNPTATTSNQRMEAGQTEFRGVPEGGNFQVSVIANA